MTKHCVGIPEATNKKPPHQRAPTRRRFHSFAWQQKYSRFDLAKMPRFHSRQRLPSAFCLTLSPPLAYLHPKHATIHSQHDHTGCSLGKRRIAAAITVVLTQPLAVTRRSFPHALRHSPDSHWTDLYSKQQPS